jgi:hypothetical protein
MEHGTLKHVCYCVFMFNIYMKPQNMYIFVPPSTPIISNGKGSIAPLDHYMHSITTLNETHSRLPLHFAT